ncbi:MAG: hypothetical protein OTI36_02765, partial [Beijerinckiaceae bacterium]|nr:hypothetical protein [Beijerinckiaceae bacterium]
MNSLAICAVGLVAEAGLGYPDALFARIGHPVTWIGAALAALDARLNRADLPAPARRARGFAALAAASGFEVDEIDTLQGGERHDVLRAEVRERLLRAIR